MESDASEFKARKDTDEQRNVPRLIIRRTGHTDLLPDSETFWKVADETSDPPRHKIHETIMTLNTHINVSHMRALRLNSTYSVFISFILQKT